jgi:uncharacterized protein with HEPN domain
MPRDARTYLWDALHAADLIVRFVGDRSFTEYIVDDALVWDAAVNKLPGLRAVLNDLVAS